MRDTSILTNNGVNVQASLELFGDMEMYDETLGNFLDMSDEKITTLEQYKNANDMPNYAIAVHALKSDSKYLGFKKLAEISLNHELKGKENDLEYIKEQLEENHKFVNDLVKGVIEHRVEIDELANRYLEDWDILRLGFTDQAIIRMGIYEILCTDTPDVTCIDEAVELAKEYSDEKVFKMINENTL